MYIKEYDLLECTSTKYKKYSSIDFQDHVIEHVSYLLQQGSFHDVQNFLKKITESFENGLFQYFAITIDDIQNLIYMSDLHYYDYSLAKNMSASKIIQLCHERSLEYNVLSKDNFIYLLTTWNKILDQLPQFALLYQNDNDWYDILPFQTQEAMKQFVADHAGQK